jgi:hypothetical protein
MMFVITKGAGKVKHIAPSLTAATLCGIAGAKTAKAAGPGAKRPVCAQCASKGK